MSLITRRRFGKNMDESNMRQTLHDAIKTLDTNCTLIDKLVGDISDVEKILVTENELILEEIDNKVQIIRQALNKYVEQVQNDLKTRLGQNVKSLRDLESSVKQELIKCSEDRAKCENTLKDLDKDDDTVNVNKTKVMEMVLSSINARKFKQPVCEIKRTVYVNTGAMDDISRLVSTSVGTLKSRKETMQEIRYPAVLVKTIEIPDIEVNAMALATENNSTKCWINQGVSTELQCFNKSGKMLNTVTTEFKVNDIDIKADGRILATSTDCFRARCIKPLKNGKCMQIYSITDKLYLHSITVSADGETLVACGTDAPNYSNQAPNEVVIIEYSPPGRELKRIAVSGYTGKVYRFVQNENRNYILTFPKDGMVLYVNGLNGDAMATFCTEDFLLCQSKYVKASDDAAFWPSGVCCNSQGHIFVTEWINKLLLMLDENCHFLRCIGSNHLCPNAVCYDYTNETLWLGDKGKIKVWEMKQLK